jgi:hypothetical protein
MFAYFIARISTENVDIFLSKNDFRLFILYIKKKVKVKTFWRKKFSVEFLSFLWVYCMKQGRHAVKMSWDSESWCKSGVLSDFYAIFGILQLAFSWRNITQSE